MKLYHFSHLKNAALNELDFALWARVHTLPRVFVERWQAKELRQLVSFAHEHSPVHRNLWRECGIHPRDVRSLGDIRKLPITTKKFFKGFPARELLGDLAPLPRRYYWKETSGSTGEPFRFPAPVYRYLSNRRKSFYEYRFLLWCDNPLYYIMDYLKSARIDEEPELHEFSITRAELRRDSVDACKKLKQFGADVVRGTPTSLFELAEHALRLPEEYRPRPRFVVSATEALTPQVRGFIAGALGGEVYNAYGLEEVGGVGIECSRHDGFHVNEESVVVEIVDERGQAVKPGTRGRVIVTRFDVDVILPFIRYDTGDYGMLLEASCSCGLRARRLSIDGRIGGFVTVGAKRFHAYEFETILNFFSADILRYQVAKVGHAKWELRIVSAKSFSPVIAENLRARFLEKFGITPLITVVDALPRTPAGKTLTVVDETKHEAVV